MGINKSVFSTSREIKEKKEYVNEDKNGFYSDWYTINLLDFAIRDVIELKKKEQNTHRDNKFSKNLALDIIPKDKCKSSIF